jgi:hypothetical protein
MEPLTRTSISRHSLGDRETSDRAASALTALLEPLTLDAFLANDWLQRHAWCRGAADRFSELLSWPILNRILEHHWREPYRFRLARQGRDLDPASYTDEGRFSKRIRAREITDQLRCGATLSFDAIDEVYPPLTRLAESFEAFFRGSTNINVYAAWRGSHGLDLHQDDQEIFIAQLDGRKRWLLYGFTIDEVDRTGLRELSTPPHGAAFDEVLTAGDLLYIPRGYYHLAVPMNEPTLHLTISVKTTSGFKPRPVFNLPWSATTEGLPHGWDFLVRLTAPSSLDVKAHAGGVVLQHSGRTYRLPRGVLAIVEQLEDGTPRPIRDVIESVAERVDEETVRLLVALLVKHGLIALTASDDGRS